MLNKKIYINIVVIVLTILLFVFLKDTLKFGEVSDSTSSILVDKLKFKKTSEFAKVYTGSINEGEVYDLKIDINNIYYSGSTVDVYFSTNTDFISYKPGEGGELNKYKAKFGYMLGRARNKEQLMWVGRAIDSLKKDTHNVLDVHEDGKLFFRSANIEGDDLFIKVVLNGIRK